MVIEQSAVIAGRKFAFWRKAEVSLPIVSLNRRKYCTKITVPTTVRQPELYYISGFRVVSFTKVVIHQSEKITLSLYLG